MKLHDAIFHWLQICVVSEARPNDKAAKETVLFFEQILREDHTIEEIQKERAGEDYRVSYVQDGNEHIDTFQQIHVDKLLQDILSEPKYT